MGPRVRNLGASWWGDPSSEPLPSLQSRRWPSTAGSTGSISSTHSRSSWLEASFFPHGSSHGADSVLTKWQFFSPPSKILMSKVKAEAVLSSVIWSREPRISLPSLSTCQKRSPKCSKQNRALLLNGRACEGEAMLTVRDVRVGMEASGILEISVVSAPLCHEPKTALESKAD